MQIPILIEPLDSNGYRVTTGQPFVLTAVKAPREETLGQLGQCLQQQLGGGAEIALVEVSTVAHSLAPYAGIFKDNLLFDAWQQAGDDYRRQVDETSVDSYFQEESDDA